MGTHSKFADLQKRMYVLDTKLSDNQKISCRRDKEFMSTANRTDDMRKELWQDLRGEMQKEFKALQNDMNQLLLATMARAKDESALAHANAPHSSQHHMENETVRAAATKWNGTCCCHQADCVANGASLELLQIASVDVGNVCEAEFHHDSWVDLRL